MNKERLIILRGLKADIDLRVAVFLEKHSHIVEKDVEYILELAIRISLNISLSSCLIIQS